MIDLETAIQNIRVLQFANVKFAEELKAANAKIERLEKMLRFAAGYISMEVEFHDLHPGEVLKWLEQEALEDAKDEK